MCLRCIHKLEMRKRQRRNEEVMKEKVVSGYRWTVNLVMQYKALAVMTIYAIFYLIAFYYLEQRTGAVHEINFEIDAYIPFCEVFIVPYLLWFGYVALTVIWLCIKDKEESERLVAFLIAGMTIFIVISAVFPNGHRLRPTVFERENIFTELIRHLYQVDTPTNVLPSIHVYNSIAIMIAVVRSRCFVNHKIVKAGMLLLGGAIICSTVLIKQHSMLDVLLAFLLSAIMYSVCYKRAVAREKRMGFVLKVK